MKIKMTDIEKIQVLTELVLYCDYVQLQEDKANSYKELKSNLNK